MMAALVMLKRNFKKWANIFVLTGIRSPALIVLAHWLGRLW